MKAEESTPKPAFDVLLVENDQLLAMNLKKHLSATETSFHFHQARNGVEAIDFLKNRESFEKAPRPHLVILDVNLPAMDGYQVLSIMRESENLKAVPTIVIEDGPGENPNKQIHTLNPSQELSSTVESVRAFLLQSIKGRAKPS